MLVLFLFISVFFPIDDFWSYDYDSVNNKKNLPLWTVKFANHSKAITLCKYTEEEKISTDTSARYSYMVGFKILHPPNLIESFACIWCLNSDTPTNYKTFH